MKKISIMLCMGIVVSNFNCYSMFRKSIVQLKKIKGGKKIRKKFLNNKKDIRIYKDFPYKPLLHTLDLHIKFRNLYKNQKAVEHDIKRLVDWSKRSEKNGALVLDHVCCEIVLNPFYFHNNILFWAASFSREACIKVIESLLESGRFDGLRDSANSLLNDIKTNKCSSAEQALGRLEKLLLASGKRRGI